MLFPGLNPQEYVANRASDKISQLTDNVYVCRSGSVSVPIYVQDWSHSHVVITCYCDIKLFEQPM